MKNVINTAAKSAITQKVAKAVVNGAASTAENAVKKASNSTINRIKKQQRSLAIIEGNNHSKK